MNEVEQNKDLVRRYTEAVWKGEDVEADFYAPDAVIHVLRSPSAVQPNMTHTAAYLRAALPDLTAQQTILFGQGDRVMQHFTISGIHTGAALFNFPPSGKPLAVEGEHIFRIANGKIVERWSILDAATLFQQLSGQ